MINTPAVPKDTPFIVILPIAYPIAIMVNTENTKNVTPVIGITPPNKLICITPNRTF